MTVINAFTVDVEDYFHASALSSAIPRERWSSCEYRVEANTERLLRLLEQQNVRATFFVLGWVAERSRTLIRRIAEAGHEIACHGYSHQLIYRQTRAEFYEETRRAKAVIEEISGYRVIGYRAASFSVIRDTLWALDVLIDLGFEYDSSIFPIHHDRYGIPGALLYPGLVNAPSGRKIVEIPMSTVSIGIRLPVSGGGYFRLYPYWITRLALATINRSARPFVFYLHPWELDPGQPRFRLGGLSRFRHYTNLRRCECRVARLLNDFSFGPAAEVLCHIGLLPSIPAGPKAAVI